MTSKGNRVLRKFFEYISLSVVPNIDVYMVTTTGIQLMSYSTLPFQLEDVKRSMKSYAVLQLKNSNYIYLTGHVPQDAKVKTPVLTLASEEVPLVPKSRPGSRLWNNTV